MSESEASFPWKFLLILVLGVSTAGLLWMQFKPAADPSSQVRPKPKLKKKPPLAAKSPASPAGDSARLREPAVPGSGDPDRSPSSDGAGGNDAAYPPPEADAAESAEAYRFARVRWEKADSRALAGRVNRLDEGYDRRPMVFRAVYGNLAFMRASTWVNPSRDRKMDRIPEKAIGEYLPEWFQRGFTIHYRGWYDAFLPRHFRLEARPAPDPAPAGKGDADALVNYDVHAYVEQPGALLLVPGRVEQSGPNGFVAAEELEPAPADSVFTREYFRALTRGPVDSLRAFALPGRGFNLVEVHARRRSPGTDGGPSRVHRGAYTFLVKPESGEIAFLVHDFDRRFCMTRKKIRFRGLLDVDGDEAGELLLGPTPSFLVYEDAKGMKYQFEEGWRCTP